MEDRHRGFEPVRLGVVGVETGVARFGDEDQDRTPAIADWRINLTALSQRHNLLFVATGDRVQVYRPDFPYQNLGRKPALTIVPHLSRPNAEGYINPDEPHNLNHLIVGELGNQEILLLSTDSGNVVAYYTNSIHTAAENNPYNFSTDGNADLAGLRPFFSQWVTESAWGLAVHTAARMIAVSANRPHNIHNSDPCSKITVFAFALSAFHPDGETAGDGEAELYAPTSHLEWEPWEPLSSRGVPATPRRDRNYKIVLAGGDGHMHNVPSVAFINTPEDTDGCWLLSTDIVGRMKMWQIWRGRCFKTWNFADPNSQWMRNDEAGWLVAALDARAFQPADSMEKFIGYCRAHQHYGHKHAGDSYDITNIVQRYTPQSSTFHPFARLAEDSSDDEEGQDILYQTMDESEDESPRDEPMRDVPEIRASRIQSTISSRQSPTFEEDATNEVSRSDSEDEDSSSEMQVEIIGDLSDEDEEPDSPNNNEETSPNSDRSITTASSYDQERSGPYDESLDESSSMSGAGPTTLPELGRTRPGSKDTFTSRLFDPPIKSSVPQIPIIQCSSSHVRLFSGPMANTPHLFCARMLKQSLPHELELGRFFLFERLNMLHQIPELGIVLIATQAGRCAVCSLTRRTSDEILGFRVDWILPTKAQEKAGRRPHGRALLGIAAGPIQGRAPPKANASSKHDNEDDWAQDRVINGVPTTFDPNVVRLHFDQLVMDDDDDDDDESFNPTHSNPHDVPPSVSLEKRPWCKPQEAEYWKAYENSRTYRLMLTYADMTVLTYELSRGVESEDVAQSRQQVNSH